MSTANTKKQNGYRAAMPHGATRSAKRKRSHSTRNQCADADVKTRATRCDRDIDVDVDDDDDDDDGDDTGGMAGRSTSTNDAVTTSNSRSIYRNNNKSCHSLILCMGAQRTCTTNETHMTWQ
jgi:hypothetical protein